jgi:4-hydroxybenzoate polyprenyltransferase
VFALNDVFDRHIDAEALRVGKGPLERYDIDFTRERHPLARGHVPFPLAIAWVSLLAAVATACSWLLSPYSMTFFLVAAAFQAVYCALRRVTPLKTLVEGSMVGLGSLAGWAAVAPLRWAAVWPFLFLTAWEIGGRNMSNDMADLRYDSAVGVRTVATVHGPGTAARVIFVVMLVDVALSLTLPVSWIGRGLAAAGGIWAMLLPGIRLLRDPTPSQAASYFNHASLYPVIAMAAVLIAIATGWLW